MQDQQEQEMTISQVFFFFFTCIALSIFIPSSIVFIGEYIRQPVFLEPIKFTGLIGSQHHFLTPIENFPKTCLFPELLVISPEKCITNQSPLGEILFMTIPSEETIGSLLYTCNGMYNVTILVKLIPIQKEEEIIEPTLRPMEIGFILLISTLFSMSILFNIYHAVKPQKRDLLGRKIY